MTIAICNTPIKNTTLHFNYGDETIAFERVNRTSDVNRVLIKVHPDCRVIAAAPPGIDDSEVVDAVKKRSRWVYEKLRDFRKQLEHVTPRRYISGESHFYLGKRYVLKIAKTSRHNQEVKLSRGKLEVHTTRKSREKVQVLLTEWYKSRAKEVFAKRLDAMLDQALWVDEKPPIRIQSMQTQWGSCSPQGRITLNPHLVKAPRECIDYVILHELCHIAEHNHSDRFYRLIQQVMPKWEKVKDRLDANAHYYLHTELSKTSTHVL
ncbi:MAG: M48 family metallopeptidase [Pseudomonadales bacterium]|nr:M48 family metallopeptidase [Pseudomonadales bacterium]